MLDLREKQKIRRMLDEDIGSGDVTSKAVIPQGATSESEVIAKQSGILAGVAEASAAFEEMGAKVEAIKGDGDRVNSGDVVMGVEGPAYGILAAERTALNLLARMSGIATATREMIDRASEVNSKVQIAATRKTAPLLRWFDKKAVEIAGGEPHRFNLEDFILVKDNHLKIVGSAAEAVERARESNPSEKIEVEVDSLEGALEAADADVIMLDNMSPIEIGNVIEELGKAGMRDELIIEASGGINPANVGEYASTDVDIISSSYMTMQAPALDLSLEIKKD